MTFLFVPLHFSRNSGPKIPISVYVICWAFRDASVRRGRRDLFCFEKTHFSSWRCLYPSRFRETRGRNSSQTSSRGGCFPETWSLGCRHRVECKRRTMYRRSTVEIFPKAPCFSCVFSPLDFWEGGIFLPLIGQYGWGPLSVTAVYDTNRKLNCCCSLFRTALGIGVRYIYIM